MSVPMCNEMKSALRSMGIDPLQFSAAIGLAVEMSMTTMFLHGEEVAAALVGIVAKLALAKDSDFIKKIEPYAIAASTMLARGSNVYDVRWYFSNLLKEGENEPQSEDSGMDKRSAGDMRRS